MCDTKKKDGHNTGLLKSPMRYFQRIGVETPNLNFLARCAHACAQTRYTCARILYNTRHYSYRLQQSVSEKDIIAKESSSTPVVGQKQAVLPGINDDAGAAPLFPTLSPEAAAAARCVSAPGALL